MVIALVIGLALAGLGMAVFAVAAAMQAGDDAEMERRLDALRALGAAEWPVDNED